MNYRALSTKTLTATVRSPVTIHLMVRAFPGMEGALVKTLRRIRSSKGLPRALILRYRIAGPETTMPMVNTILITRSTQMILSPELSVLPKMSASRILI